MIATGSSSEAGRATGRPAVEISISIRTVVLVAAAVALAWALSSIASVLLLIFVSGFSIAVLSPVAAAMGRRFGWSRALCATVLVLGIVVALGAVALVVVQAISSAVRELGDDLPLILDRVRHSDLIWATS